MSDFTGLGLENHRKDSWKNLKDSYRINPTFGLWANSAGGIFRLQRTPRPCPGHRLLPAGLQELITSLCIFRVASGVILLRWRADASLMPRNLQQFSPLNRRPRVPATAYLVPVTSPPCLQPPSQGFTAASLLFVECAENGPSLYPLLFVLHCLGPLPIPHNLLPHFPPKSHPSSSPSVITPSRPARQPSIFILSGLALPSTTSCGDGKALYLLVLSRE